MPPGTVIAIFNRTETPVWISWTLVDGCSMVALDRAALDRLPTFEELMENPDAAPQQPPGSVDYGSVAIALGKGQSFGMILITSDGPTGAVADPSSIPCEGDAPDLTDG